MRSAPTRVPSSPGRLLGMLAFTAVVALVVTVAGWHGRSVEPADRTQTEERVTPSPFLVWDEDEPSDWLHDHAAQDPNEQLRGLLRHVDGKDPARLRFHDLVLAMAGAELVAAERDHRPLPDPLAEDWIRETGTFELAPDLHAMAQRVVRNKAAQQVALRSLSSEWQQSWRALERAVDRRLGR